MFDDTKYQVKYDRCFNRRFDNSEIASFVDIDSFVPIKQGLQRCLRDCLKRPSFRKVNIKEQALFDRISKEVYTREVFEDAKSYHINLLYRYIRGVEYMDCFKLKFKKLIYASKN